MVRAAMALVHKLGWDPFFARRSPWFWPLSRVAQRLATLADWPTLDDYARLYAELTAHADVAALRFGPNVDKHETRVDGRVKLGALYDGRIAVHDEVPTRERDWHDLFNMACFATFPRAKRALHLRQFAALQQRVGDDATRLPPARSREQDALTLFDEGGVAVAATPEAAASLAHAEPATLPELLAALEHAGTARTVPFGHAIFEHLVEGLTAPGSGTRVLTMATLPTTDDALLDAVDRGLCAMLRDPACFRSPKEHVHLRFNRMRLLAPDSGAADA